MSKTTFNPITNQYSLTLLDLTSNLTSIYIPYVDCYGYRSYRDPGNLLKINRFFELLRSKQYKLVIKSHTNLNDNNSNDRNSAECCFPSDLKLVHNLKDGKRTYYIENGCKLEQTIQLFSQEGSIPMITISTENEEHFAIYIHDMDLYSATLISNDGESTPFTSVIIIDNTDGTSTNVSLDRPRHYLCEVHPLMEIFKWVGISGSDFHFTLTKRAY